MDSTKWYNWPVIAVLLVLWVVTIIPSVVCNWAGKKLGFNGA